MKYLVLMGSPRKDGNTIKLVEPFMQELEKNGQQAEMIWLYDKHINGCLACRCCQRDWTKFGCAHNDDMQEIFDAVLDTDVIVLALPIYCWGAPAPMKAALDRLMYGMNKYYGDEKGPSIWAGKHVALLETCGYRPEKGSDLFEESMRRYCKHSQLIYDGSMAQRDLGYKATFIDSEKIKAAKDFALELINKNHN